MKNLIIKMEKENSFSGYMEKLFVKWNVALFFWGDAGKVFLMQFFDQHKNFEFPTIPFWNLSLTGFLHKIMIQLNLASISLGFLLYFLAENFNSL